MNFPTPEVVTEWLNGLTPFDRDNEIILFCIFAAFGKPESMLDVGSGTGAMVNVAEKLNVDANGIDILPRPNHPRLFQRDLEQPIKLLTIPGEYSLVTSIETAEHIRPEYADTLIDTICNHAVDRIVFTAAMPGQGGHGHVNCQPATYWREKFYKRGWDYSAGDTHRLALLLSNAWHASHHVEANLQVFKPISGK